MSASHPQRNLWGTITLVMAALGFLCCLFVPWPRGWQLSMALAFFEASLVGALADWFAITALFRRPLGLPLPHTDVLVRRKDELVEAFPQFLASFLVPDRVHPLLSTVDWAALLAKHVEPDDLDRLLVDGLTPLLHAPGHHAWEQGAIDLGTDLLFRELSRHKETLVGPMTELVKRNAGWRGLFVSRDAVDDAVEGFLEELRAVRDRPDHPLRASMVAAFREAWPRLQEQLRPSRWTSGAWKRLQDDQVFRESFNRKASEVAAVVWDRTEAAATLTTGLRLLLAQTDARTLSRRIEKAVNSDLQYIRVNGALVGGLVGLILEGLRLFLGY